MNAKAAKGLYADRDHWKKLSAELSDRLCEKEQQFQAIKEAYRMSSDCFDEICKHVIDYNLTGDDLEEKLNECREYDRRMNGE